MRFVLRVPREETHHVVCLRYRFIFEVPLVKRNDEMCILTVLSEVVNVFENQALVEPADELVEEELAHMWRYELTFERRLLNEPSYLDVVMS